MATDNLEPRVLGGDDRSACGGLHTRYSIPLAVPCGTQQSILRAARYVLAQLARVLDNSFKDEDPVVNFPDPSDVSGPYLSQLIYEARYLLCRITPLAVEQSQECAGKPGRFHLSYEEHVDRVFKAARLRIESSQIDQDFEAAHVEPWVLDQIDRGNVTDDEETTNARVYVRSQRYLRLEREAACYTKFCPADMQTAFDNLLAMKDQRGRPCHDVLHHAITLWMGPSGWATGGKEQPKEYVPWDKVDHTTDLSAKDLSNALDFL